jgi:hypothetical protein
MCSPLFQTALHRRDAELPRPNRRRRTFCCVFAEKEVPLPNPTLRRKRITACHLGMNKITDASRATSLPEFLLRPGSQHFEFPTARF